MVTQAGQLRIKASMLRLGGAEITYGRRWAVSMWSKDGPESAARYDRGLYLGAIALEIVLEINDGKVPRTIWQLRRTARRFGARLSILPHGIQDAFLRQADDGAVICVPRYRDRDHLRFVILHEIIEALCRWEGRPLVLCNICDNERLYGSLSRHDIACHAVLLARKADTIDLIGHPMISPPEMPCLENLPTGELTPAQNAVCAMFHAQMDLWMAQTEVIQTQTELFREMAQQLFKSGKDGGE